MRLLLPLLLGLQCALAAELPANGPAVWGVLDQSLHDGNVERRQQALAALSTMGDMRDAVERVESMLDDKEVIIRQSAALALGNMKAYAAIPRLQQAIDDNSPEVSFAAAKALTELGDPSGEPMLIAVLAGQRKEGPGMMENAMRKAKDKLHHPEELALMGAQDATGAMFGPVSLAIPAVKDAMDMKGKGAPGRSAAAAYLAKDPSDYAVTLLEWALTDDNQFVRMEAARGLGQRGNSASIPKLEALLGDSKPMVRDMAAASILRILDRNGAPGTVSSAPVVVPNTAKK